MPAFNVTAYTADGQPTRITVQAFDASAAEKQVRDRALFPSSITPRRSFMTSPARLKLSRTELAELFTHLELQLSSGNQAVQAISVLKDRLTSKPLRILLNEVHDHLISARGNLTSAFKNHPRTFPPDILTVIRAGEDSGNLDRAFAELRERVEFTAEIRRTISSALLYPLFLCVMGFGLIVYFMSFTVPKLTKIVKELNAEIPALTQFVIAAGDWFAEWWPVIVFGSIGIVGTFLFLRSRDKIGTKIDGYLLKLPLYGLITQHLSSALFCRIFRSLYLSKFSALDSLELCSSLLPNKELRARLRRSRRLIRDGQSLGTAFQMTAALPPEACAIITSGEASGQLDRSLLRVSAFYSDVAKHRIRFASSLLGPLLIACLGGIIGVTVIAMVLPLMNLSMQIR